MCCSVYTVVGVDNCLFDADLCLNSSLVVAFSCVLNIYSVLLVIVGYKWSESVSCLLAVAISSIFPLSSIMNRIFF